MSKITKAKGNLNSNEIKKKIKNTKGFWKVQKWLVIYNAKEFSLQAEEIAKHLAVTTSFVHKTISKYNRYGESSIETQGKGGRRNSYMGPAEEEKFMSKFIEEAKKGLIVTAQQIKEAFEEQVGKKVHKTTIYRLLARSGWRKIVPLPHHPKKDEESQKSFKKTFPRK
jgi:transposase